MNDADSRRDNTSDPANSGDEGSDWSAEGGATRGGPATAVPEEKAPLDEDEASS